MNDLYEIRMTKQMGRGVFAKKEIPIDTKLMDLEKRKFLMYNIVSYHLFFGNLCDLRQVNNKVHFAFYLAFADKYRKYEKNYSPKVIKYIDNLPKQYHSLICWNQDQLNMINDKKLINRAVQKKNRIHEQFLKVKKFLQKCSDSQITPNYQNQDIQYDQTEYQKQKSQEYINQSEQTQPEQQKGKIDCKQYKRLCSTIIFEDFLNFYTAVETRHIYQNNNYQSRIQLGALVPVLEMFNHCPEGQAKKDSYFLKTIKPIKKDQQIFVSYGDHDNQRLFFDYGFFIDDYFHQVKNQYIPKLNESQIQQNKTNQTCSQFRVKLAQKYNQLLDQKSQKIKKQQNENKI